MTHGFDKEYWEQRWRQGSADGPGPMGGNPPNPYLARETSELVPGTALDAGCGAGAEAIWLASRGWQVTAADISSALLERLEPGHAVRPGQDPLRPPGDAAAGVLRPHRRMGGTRRHPADRRSPPHPQRHRRRPGPRSEPGAWPRSGHHPPAEASTTAAAITARLDETAWEVVTAEECHRTLIGHGGGEAPLHDVVVRATRRH
jgi:hypothetical protein